MMRYRSSFIWLVMLASAFLAQHRQVVVALVHVGQEPVGRYPFHYFSLLRRRHLRELHRDDTTDRDVDDRIERRLEELERAVDLATVARFFVAAAVHERGF